MDALSSWRALGLAACYLFAIQTKRLRGLLAFQYEPVNGGEWTALQAWRVGP